jgi:hypothetical protein
MNDDRAQDALRLAEAALADALREGVTEAEALVMSEDSALTRFANSEIHQNVAETNVTINLRVVVGKRVGVASSGRTDAQGLRRLAENAAAIARVVEELEDWGGLPGRTEIRDVAGAYSRTTAHASPEFRAEAVRAVIGAAGRCRGHRLRLVRHGDRVDRRRQLGRRTRLRDAHDLAAHHGLDGARRRQRVRESAAVDASTIDAAALGREASGKAQGDGQRDLGRPRRLPGRARGIRRGRPARHARLPRVLGPCRPGGAQLLRGRQADRQRPGDDRRRRRRPAGLPLWFDYEGVAKQRVELVDRGICREVVYDSQTAARDGVASTGHGLPAPNPWGPFPLNMFMDAGDAPRDDLIAGLDRGLLVTRFHYTNPSTPSSRSSPG